MPWIFNRELAQDYYLSVFSGQAQTFQKYMLPPINIFYILKKEAAGSYETLVPDYRTTQRQVSERRG